MSDSVRPHRRQPTRLPRLWDSPGNNTVVSCHFLLPCMKVKSEREVAPLCPTLSDPMDYSLPGSSVHGIFQARVLEWGASSLLSHIQLFANPQTVAHQGSLSMEFSKQEYWSGLPFSSLENLPDPGIKPWSPAFQPDSLPFELQGSLRVMCG